MSGISVRGDALQSEWYGGSEFVRMEHASRDVALLLASIKGLMDALGEGPDAEDLVLVDQIATDYGVPRWASEY